MKSESLEEARERLKGLSERERAGMNAVTEGQLNGRRTAVLPEGTDTNGLEATLPGSASGTGAAIEDNTRTRAATADVPGDKPTVSKEDVERAKAEIGGIRAVDGTRLQTGGQQPESRSEPKPSGAEGGASSDARAPAKAAAERQGSKARSA